MSVNTPKPVLELQAGDLVDLEGDRYADPNGDVNALAFEYGAVERIERETNDCVLVYFTNFDAVGFPTDHQVPVYDLAKDRAAVARSVVNVVTAIGDRGGKVPSKDVQRAAAELVMERKIVQHVGPARLFHIEGGRGINYPITVVFGDDGPDAPVSHAECSCDAARGGLTCKHLTAVLAQLSARGHDLQV